MQLLKDGIKLSYWISTKDFLFIVSGNLLLIHWNLLNSTFDYEYLSEDLKLMILGWHLPEMKKKKQLLIL